MQRQFRRHLLETNVKGSNKASSYLNALKYLGEILSVSNGPFKNISSIWEEDDPKVIDALYEYIKVQQKTGEIFQTEHAPSYWNNGYYSAALKSYRDFLIEHQYEEILLEKYSHVFNPSDFKVDPGNSDLLIKEYGKDKISEVKTRVGQNVFRKEILRIYQDQCCITGLNIPQINRASHIIPWSENEGTRMDPANGLCLSATYDAAFDKNLFSLDEDYRIILSKNLKENYTKEVVKTYFHNLEGQRIQMPSQYVPKQEYLEKHREKMVG